VQSTSRHELVGLLLRRVSRLTTRVYRRQLKELGLTTRQATALLALSEEPGMALGRLAEVMGADQATVSQLVDRLLSAELVLRSADPEDRRRVRLFASERALGMAAQLQQTRESSERLIEAALGEKETKTLRDLLMHLRTSLERPTSLGE
jgi:DNA-binding MarR family transcriptional regulator